MSGSDALTVLSLPFGGAYLGLAPQEPSGPPKFLTLLSTHTTLFVDPDRPSGNSPKRFLCVGFWGVKPIAVCMSRDHGAVSSFRECGLPYGLRGALCTLHPCCSVCTSFTGATLGRSGWLDLPPQGLTPCKKHQASLGALTLAVSRAQWRERRRSGRYSPSAPGPGSACPERLLLAELGTGNPIQTDARLGGFQRQTPVEIRGHPDHKFSAILLGGDWFR